MDSKEEIKQKIYERFNLEKSKISEDDIELAINSYVRNKVSRTYYSELEKEYDIKIIFGSGGSQTKTEKECIINNIPFLRIFDVW